MLSVNAESVRGAVFSSIYNPERLIGILCAQCPDIPAEATYSPWRLYVSNYDHACTVI